MPGMGDVLALWRLPGEGEDRPDGAQLIWLPYRFPLTPTCGVGPQAKV